MGFKTSIRVMFHRIAGFQKIASKIARAAEGSYHIIADSFRLSFRSGKTGHASFNLKTVFFIRVYHKFRLTNCE